MPPRPLPAPSWTLPIAALLAGALAWHLTRPAGPPAEPTAGTEARRGEAQARDAQRGALLSAHPSAAVMGDASADAGAAETERMIRRARTDPAYRLALLAGYRRGHDPERRHLLSVVLAAVADADVRDTALAMAAGPDPGRRMEGLELLQSFTLEDAAVRRHVAGSLASERDPAARLHLLRMLDPAGVPETERPDFERHLLAAAVDSDPRLRAAAVARLDRWRPGADLEPRLLAALTDAEMPVRVAAIETAGRTGSGSEALATTLLAIAGDAERSPEERAAARHAAARLATTMAPDTRLDPADHAYLLGTIPEPVD